MTHAAPDITQEQENIIFSTNVWALGISLIDGFHKPESTADKRLGNPRSCEWGNISWGHATSQDLVHWKHHSTKKNPALSPVDAYDKEGVFTGCFLPQGVNGEPGQMSVIYSSINHLPLHWTIPYVRGCEGISIATSDDHGVFWNKLSQNPVLEEEPHGLDVTGFRDPYVAPWPALDKLRGCATSLYGIVSGGIRHKGPAVFLYAIDPGNLAEWSYLGRLMDSPANLRKSLKWSGDFGVNWECAGFMNLNSRHDTISKDFIVTGTEGGEERPWVKLYLAGKPDDFPRRTTRYCIWIAGSLTRDVTDDTVSFSHEFDGILDHGCFYAANTFYDPSMQRRVLWGWLPEEDVPIDHCKGKGWNGSLAVPRELFLHKMTSVTRALRSSLDNVASIQATQDVPGETYTIETLGIAPLPDLSALRTSKPHILTDVSLPRPTTSLRWFPLRGNVWEMKAMISIGKGCSGVGIIVKHNQDRTTGTSIKFHPEREEIVVDRSKSNDSTEINKCDERGSFTLFEQDFGFGEELEKLRLHIFCDGDILEVFANDRFALSTMIYTTELDADEISLLGEGLTDSVRFEEIQFWSGMSKIFCN